MNKKFIVSSKEKRELVFIPIHKKWVQLSKLIITTTKSNLTKTNTELLYYIYQIPWLAEFEQQAEFDKNGILVKQAYLIENFDLLIQKAESELV